MTLLDKLRSEKKLKTASLLERVSLKGKTAVVTGAVGLLGKQFCAGLAASGANVVVTDLNKAEAVSYASELGKEFGTKALGLVCDVTKPEQVRDVITETVRCFGEINILLSNAATKTETPDAFFAPFEDYSLKTWQEVMAVNIDGMFLVSQAVGKQMIEQGTKGGSIILTSSIYGLLASDHRIYEDSSYQGRQIGTPAVYAASKGAVIALARYLAAYWAKYHIRVNALIPGGVESDQNDTFKGKYAERVPLKRMARGDELVGALLYLASDASSYVTGQNLIVDGGLSAW